MASVDSAGVPIHYELDGEGPPIVLVHGFITSLEANWRQTGWIDFLVAQGHTVVGLDCRGHGLSGKPHDPSAYDGNQMADDVLAVMDAMGLDRAALMGYSKVITYTLAEESGASLKAVGGRIVGEMRPQEWSVPSRPRKSQPVYGQAKVKWEL